MASATTTGSPGIKSDLGAHLPEGNHNIMTKIRTGAAVLLGGAGLSAIASLVPATALLVATAPSAQASASQDAAYVSCVTPYVYNTYGPSVEATLGRSYATDISLGIRTPYQEQRYVYANTNDSVTQADANALVNCATEVWLGYGPS
jgi:hypothetical protein